MKQPTINWLHLLLITAKLSEEVTEITSRRQVRNPSEASQILIVTVPALPVINKPVGIQPWQVDLAKESFTMPSPKNTRENSRY